VVLVRYILGYIPGASITLPDGGALARRGAGHMIGARKNITD
jgi:hypothetical protein